MNGLEGMAKALIGIGLLIIILGLIFLFISKVGGINLFRLPGDIYIKKENFTLYFPITSFLLLSIILTILFNLFFRR